MRAGSAYSHAIIGAAWIQRPEALCEASFKEPFYLNWPTTSRSNIQEAAVSSDPCQRVLFKGCGTCFGAPKQPIFFQRHQHNGFFIAIFKVIELVDHTDIIILI